MDNEIRDPMASAAGNDDLNQYILIVPRSSASELNGDQKSSPPARKKKIANKDSLAEELQHASDMNIFDNTETEDMSRQIDTASKSSQKSSDSDSIKVEILDWGNDGSFNFTTSTLRKCKQQVLRPYWGLLVFIGWRGFHKESVYVQMWRWRVLNMIYPSVITLLLFYTYMYEILACEWKLNLDQEKMIVTPQPTVSTTPNHTSLVWSDLVTGHTPTKNGTPHNIGCDHIITTYMIPNLLHFLAYLMGMYYFRVQENEQLYALMEKVFLQATPVQAKTASQQKMIYKLRLFLIFGSVWVIMTVLLQCLYVWAFNFPRLPLFETIGTAGYWILFSVELLGRAQFNCIILAIVMNYATQCEMIKFYVRGIGMRLQEKSTDLKTAMKDVLMLKQSLGLLNGIISNMTSLASVILGELTIIGMCILFLNKHDEPKVWVYRGFFPGIWACMLFFPLIQAARVNSICLRVQKIGLEMRVFGYKGASILDLDSFLQFVACTKLKAKLFHIPILPSYLLFSAVVTTFVLLLLVQTSSIGPAGYIV